MPFAVARPAERRNRGGPERQRGRGAATTNRAPSFWDHNEQALYLYGSALYDRAIAEFEEAIRLASVALPALLINLGAAYLRSGRYEKARAVLVDGLALDPDDQLGHWYLGETLEALGEPFDARAEFQTTVQLDPDSPEGRAAEESITRLWTSRWSTRR